MSRTPPFPKRPPKQASPAALRKYKANARRPFRLPEFMKYVALAMAVFYAIIWLYGGIYYAKIGNTVRWNVALTTPAHEPYQANAAVIKPSQPPMWV